MVTPPIEFNFNHGVNLEYKHPATVPFVGLTPGFVGLYQINVLIPDDLPYQIVYLLLGYYSVGQLAIGVE